MNDITMTVVGNVVRDVELRFTTAGDPVASFRIASSTRRFDRASERWVDSDTHYFTVTCWRSMAHNVVQSLAKGMPVVVTGRLRSREVERPCGEQAHIVRFHDIEAIAVGPDLARGAGPGWRGGARGRPGRCRCGRGGVGRAGRRGRRRDRGGRPVDRRDHRSPEPVA